jgi:putative ABC transport system permease protein
MTTAVLARPVARRTRAGSAPARRAVIRWAWRLFRREWRRQALILALLAVAVAATIAGLAVVSNVAELGADPTFGTANTIITVPGSDSRLAADIAAIRSRFGTVDVVSHQSIPVPGSVSTIDLRAENPDGPYAAPTVRLDAGRYPTGSDEVAVTKGVAQLFDLHIGGVWRAGGRTWQVVGLVENPLNLQDRFALATPGPASPTGTESMLVDTTKQAIQSFNLPGNGVSIAARGTASKTAAEALVLVLATMGLLFVGLLAVAGFAVMAQRRLRALGMLGSIGATDRQVRLVLLANGAAVGATAAAVGAALGLAGWLALAPSLQSVVQHRIDRFDLPWWAIATALVLAFVTAVVAAWWPARAVARIPIVAALSGRPPRPQPAHRFAAAGGVLLGAGLVLLAFADQRRAPFIVAGTVATVIGILFLAPLAIRALATLAGRTTIAVRLAMRDLARYQSRSGAALGAVTLAVGIAATIAVAAAAAQAPPAVANLPTNQLVVYVGSGATGPGNPVPVLTPDQQNAAQASIDQLASTLHARAVLPLEGAVNPDAATLPAQPGPGGGPGGQITAALARVAQRGQGEEVQAVVQLYVATPALLAQYGLKAEQIEPAADVITSRTGLGALEIFLPELINSPSGDSGPKGAAVRRPRPAAAVHPTIETVKQLPAYGSAPNSLITSHGMQALGLEAVTAGWLVQAPAPLTAAQIDSANHVAASAGLSVETTTANKSLAPVRNWSTAAGILVALGVLAMTVGLIRSESGRDLRTLTATGASRATRRTLTGATAGALALLGALLGTAGAYVALLAWYRSNLHPLTHVPVANLAIIIAGLPLIAAAAGWLFAGREPPAIARQPLE